MGDSRTGKRVGPRLDILGMIRELATRHRFALNKAELRENPEAFVGLLKDAAGALRVLLTGSTRSPELDVIAEILGPDEVTRRVRAVL